MDAAKGMFLCPQITSYSFHYSVWVDGWIGRWIGLWIGGWWQRGRDAKGREEHDYHNSTCNYSDEWCR